MRFYPDHATAVSTGTAFAEDDTGEDAKLGRQETMWRVGLADRKVNLLKTSHGTYDERNATVDAAGPKYAEFIIFSNVVIMCEGTNINESINRCNSLVSLIE